MDAGACLDSLYPCRNLRAFPSVGAKVALEGSELGILLLQGGDIRLVAHVVQPPVLDGDLFAHLLLELVPGHLIVANFSPYDAAKGLGYLRHGWLVSGKIYLSPDPALRVLKGYGGEGPYVRQVFARITEQGLQRLAETTPTHLSGIRERFLGRLSQTQLKELTNIWSQLLETDGQQSDESPGYNDIR